jgi:hypothetical protein
MIERDEDTFAALQAMAEDIHLVSRNHNDELIGIEYYQNLGVLTDEQLALLIDLWSQKCTTCYKERLASQWMLVQMFILIGFANYVAWLSGGIAGAMVSAVSVFAMIAMMEDKRVSKAKQNLADARRVLEHLNEHSVSR